MTITDEQLAELLAKAEAATQSEWVADTNYGYCFWMAVGPRHLEPEREPADEAMHAAQADARFIAAANPETVKALVAEVERLRDRVEQARREEREALVKAVHSLKVNDYTGASYGYAIDDVIDLICARGGSDE